MMWMIALSAIICPTRHIVLEFNFILICVNPVHRWLAFSFVLGSCGQYK